ncbi:esterase-like activity of phytase family protein [Brevibacillus sp. AG]|uniref:esterase-like activity of phytase family protein n=1 Tax=Brevibacillus sp. AG TaxID=3020891 RepID=UPI0023302313|nr:esterase-like activity of phytase family protein [Brevibacillus sp. AG]MDC0761102.1 esterase-like activity of phytase family protein [Brevibacillus sp. AG]
MMKILFQKKSLLVATIATLSLIGTQGAGATQNVTGAPVVAEIHEWKTPPALTEGIKEGGFSGLVHLPNDPPSIFYTLADRGPNGQYGKDELRTFPDQNYTPRMYKIKVENGNIHVLETIKLRLPQGKINPFTKTTYISGLPNLAGPDEVPYDVMGTKKLSYDPDGLDLEGIAYNPIDDTFWLSDEYRPSIIQVKRDGTILGRYVPKGAKEALLAAGAQIEIFDTLPAVYSKRIANRGFEGVTISPDGKFLYTSIQSPMALPDKKTGEASRNLRILKMDLATKKVVGEYMYIAENAKDFVKVKQKDVVISDLAALSQDVLLIDERDKNAGANAQLKRIYKADFSKATNLLGTSTSEQDFEKLTVAQVKEKGIVPISKELLVDVAKLNYPHEKLEGLAIVDKNTIAIVNDNDFGVDGYDEKGKIKINSNPTQMYVIKVGKDLK